MNNKERPAPEFIAWLKKKRGETPAPVDAETNPSERGRTASVPTPSKETLR